VSGRVILVTGGAGFIGSHLVETLLARGDQVVVLDNFDSFYDPQIKRRNIATSLSNPKFTLIEGDIRNDEDLNAAFRAAQYDAVIHLAARAGVRPSIADPELYDSVNLVGTTKILQNVQQHNIPALIFGSSSSVYGSNSPIPFSEDYPAVRPSSPYAATKRAGELSCYTFHELYGTDITCLRFFTVYGPRQRPEMAIHRFTRLLAAGEDIEVFGDGTALRDFTYVDDIVNGVVRSLDRAFDRTLEGHPGYRIYNLGTTATTTVTNLAEMIADVLGVPLKVRYESARPGDVPITYADISHAAHDLGYQPTFPLRAGIESFVAWFRAARPELAEATAS
jgi:UDP-glucuronate 4-epimerase